MSNVSQWSTSAASNNSAAPNGFPEGMAPSAVNDAAREVMAAVSRWHEDLQGGLVSTGAGNTYAITSNSTHAALADQSIIAFRADKTNTGAATLNVDSLGAKNIQSGGANVAASEIISGSIIVVAYNSNSDAYDLLNTLSASQLSTKLSLGSLATLSSVPDGSLSSNVPLKDAANVFSEAQTIQLATPRIWFIETDAAADNGTWSVKVAAEGLFFSAWNDALSVETAFISVARTGTTVDSINFEATSIQFNGGDLPIAMGGTAASTASAARTNLGLAIGSDVQAYDADLAAIAALAKTDGNIIVGNGSTWVAESGATARTSLGLGSLATQSTINNDDWSGADLAVANGGTGTSTSTGTGSVVLSDSPTFTGTPAAPTAPLGTSTTQLATTAFVQAEVATIEAQTTKYKTADETVNNSGTLQDDDHLTGFTLDTGAVYKVEGFIVMTSPDAADWKANLSFTNTPVDYWLGMNGMSTAGAHAGDLTGPSQADVFLDTATASTSGAELIGFIRANASTGGTVKLQWAQLNATVGDTILKAGSWMTLTKIS